MGNSVDVYTRTDSGIGRLADKISALSQAESYQFRSESAFFKADLDTLIGIEGKIEITVGLTDLGETGDPGVYEDTALEPYEYEISIEFRRVPNFPTLNEENRLGRLVFERLTELGYPMSYVDHTEKISAVFFPGRGIRDVLPPLPIEDTGLKQETSAALGTADRTPAPGFTLPVASSCLICSIDKVLAFTPEVSRSEIPLTPPIAVVRANDSDQKTLGGLVASTLERSAAATGSDSPSNAPGILLDISRKTAEKFAEEAKFLSIGVENGEVTVTPRQIKPTDGTSPTYFELDTPGPPIHRRPIPKNEDEFGILIKKAVEEG